MICVLCNTMDVEQIFLLHLWDSALIIYQHLDREVKAILQHIKKDFINSYTSDSFIAYNQFVMQWLCLEEMVNKYLADSQWLDLHFWEWWMAWAFISGLPQHIRCILWVLLRIGSITLEQLVTWAWAVMTKDLREITAAAQQANEMQANWNAEVWDHLL